MNDHVKLNPVDPERVKDYMPLLLMADESEEIIMEYLYDGEVYAVESEGHTVGVLIMTDVSSRVVEVRNMAVAPAYRGRGIGKMVLDQITSLYSGKGKRKIIVGTANSSIANLAFYQKAGFRLTCVKKDFFKRYPDPIYENGIRALDMVMMEKEL
ncbi:GNAT family N-acetyltransferase [Bacillus sp. KH172YL63]|uniref:GNAT family N-acetyltransferase n=1 Tax=Bacillus sp. KH172YL63 TaxID=2709784 RepID=UPI0013E45E56|nr:GNAT family N-acetyltransferase [Bacillus sp. KH172YL63]BCB03665.1 N-acetyltransferase [Bacillus sp. KH172YL63]